MKRLLVPTDFSKPSYYALDVAADLAKKNKAEVYILHVVDLPSYLENDQEAFQKIPEGMAAMEMIRKKLNSLANKANLEGVNVHQVIKFENIYANIKNVADDYNIDLIIMGSRGSSGLHEIFMGSNAQKVVRMSDCPVLTVKDRVKNFEFGNLIFASDFAKIMYKSFEPISKIAAIYKSTIHLLKVITPSHFETTAQSHKSILDFIKAVNIRNYTINVLNHTNIEEGILEFADSKDADVITMATEGRSQLKQLFNASLAERVVNHSSLPVLSVRILK